MLKIRCSSLEDVRKNPTAYAQQMALGDGKNNGGTHGMFAYWQDIAKLVHQNELTTAEGVKELQNKFIRFDDTPKNRSKQSLLLDQFVKYCNLYDKNKFAFVDSRRQMNWALCKNVSLTGLTPWVVYNDSGYYSYFVTEQPFEWQDQLKFPLLQQYLVDYKIDCDVTEMNMGIYCLATNKFEFNSYTKAELKKTVTLTTEIFEHVYDQFTKLKK